MSDWDKIRIGRGNLGRVIAFRLGPGLNLLQSLEEIARRENIGSGVILSGAGSLRQVTLRNVRLFPDKFPVMDRNRIYTLKKEPLELLSLSGNIAKKGDEVYIHCHITVSSGLDDGRAYGGHLIEDCEVFSYCEIVIAEITGLEMKRETDPETQGLELFFT